MASPGKFIAELGRRNVLRAAVLYIGAVWALAQGIASLGPSVGAPEWVTRWFLVAVAIGFPFWLAFAWFYEFTPDGLKRESEIDPADSITAHTSKKLDRLIIAVLAVAIVLLLTDRFVLRHGVNEEARTPVPEQSIAVLPFVNMSDDKANEYFSDGISEELLNLLAKIPQLEVTARTSSFSFKGKDTAIPEIARMLHVAHVLEGSVRKAGNSVRITAQLIKADSGNHLWSQTYDRKLDDIFAIQDEIAADVVKELKIALLGAAPKARTTDPEAYALYLEAIQVGRQFTNEALLRSDALYRKALAIDPRYAPAWDGLARNFITKAAIGALPGEEAYPQALYAAEQALAIDPDYAPAQARLGLVANDRGDLAGAAQHLKRALALDPSDLNVLQVGAGLLVSLGRLQQAVAIHEYAVARDPVAVTRVHNLGYHYRFSGRYDEALARFHTVQNLLPGYGTSHFHVGVTLLLKGDAAGALVEMEQETNEFWRSIGLPMAYHALGRKADSDAALAALIAAHEKESPYNIAYVYALRGDADNAFVWLDKAVQYADPGLSEILADNLFDGIRKDPRYLPFLRKLGKAPEQLAKIEFEVTLPDAGASAKAAAP